MADLLDSEQTRRSPKYAGAVDQDIHAAQARLGPLESRDDVALD